MRIQFDSISCNLRSHDSFVPVWVVLLLTALNFTSVAAQAEPPTDIAVINLTTDSFVLIWNPGLLYECGFVDYQVELRAAGGGQDWFTPRNCSIFAPSDNNCSVGGLKPNTEYAARVGSTCRDPQHASPLAAPKYPFWTLPGRWTTVVGTSETFKTTVDVGSTPGVCRVKKECCDDQFGVCYGGDLGHVVVVMRYDALEGWGQNLRVTCRAQAVMDFTPPPVLEPAAAPTSIEIVEASQTSIHLTFQLGAVNDCACAALNFAVRANDTSLWVVVPPDICNDTSTRECTIPELQPDTMYHARIWLSCSNGEDLSSGYRETTAPFPTKPGCAWTTHSGADYQLECANGELCDVQEMGWTCCIIRGGRHRCPRVAPMMCAGENDCSNQTDRCCDLDCSDHSGPRPCDIPAKSPELLDVVSESTSTLTIYWRRRQYFAGESHCDFLHWHAEVAEVHPEQGLMDWTRTEGCTGGSIETTSCTARNLKSGTSYLVRLVECCLNSDLNSEPAYFHHPVMTIGRFPEPPKDVMWEEATPQSFSVRWMPGAQHECEFKAWEVEAYLLADHADGSSGWERWSTVCWNTDFTMQNCTVAPALSGRQYRLRIREHCEDSRIMSPYGICQQPAQTLPRPLVPARHPTNVTIAEVDSHSLNITWKPGKTMDCIFLGWELQLQKWELLGNRPSEWPEGSRVRIRPRCLLNARKSTACLVPKLKSNTLYEARIRETCSDPKLNSRFALSQKPLYTPIEVADVPTIINATALTPHSIRVAWKIGAPGDCQFLAWSLEWNLETMLDQPWNKAVGISQLPRNTTSFVVDGLASESPFVFRLRETCVRSAMNSPTFEWPFATWTPVEPPSRWDPRYITIQDLSRSTDSQAVAMPAMFMFAFICGRRWESISRSFCRLVRRHYDRRDN